MSDKKSQHILSIQQVLAEFDIETQVRQMTLQVMDSYALGNKQAFSYIKQWETKFIDFQGRLSVAENYYRNIQINVNSKIEVTHAVNQRLQKFAQQFWSGMKQSAESIEQMRKNYMNLVKEAGSHAATLRSLQKQVRQTNSKIQIINSNFNEQTIKLVQKIAKNQDQIILRNNQYRSESQNILLKMSQAKAQLNSKTQILDELCKDINLYKNEKVSINSQIASIYEQLNNRVLISDFNQIRVYIDNGVNQTTLKLQQNYRQLKQQIEAEVKIRSIETQQQSTLRQKLKEQIQIQIKTVKQNIQHKHEIVIKSIQQLTNKAQKNYKQNWQRITKNTQRIQKIDNSIEQINIKIRQILANLQAKDNCIQQVESNILSINQILKQIQKQNYSRGQQLAKLKVDADDKGDIGQKIKKIAQRVLSHDESVRKINEENNIINTKIQNYNTSILMRMNEHQIKNNQQFSKLDFILKSQTEHINTKYDKRCQIIEKNVEEKHRQVLQQFSNTLSQKIDSMKDKFVFLQNLSSDMQKFKQQFQQQLDMNDELNKQIKQKMDRIFGMFTKLKSDLFLKIQAISLEIGRNTTKLKQNSNKLVDLCFLTSQINQIISTMLCVQLWTQLSQDKQSTQQYKIASMLQGWVLELLKDKAKYRGQNITRKALIQICLEHHVKTGDKIKGSLIENGKQVFNKMVGGNEEYQQLKRRSISRKKQRQSELPKVYK